MQLYPEVQTKAQREIDALTEGRRFASFQIRVALPYIDAIVKENTQWNPVAPLEVFSCEGQETNTNQLEHWTMKDDVYQGMFIPHGTTVLSNVRYARLPTFFRVDVPYVVFIGPFFTMTMCMNSQMPSSPKRFLLNGLHPIGAPNPNRAAFGGVIASHLSPHFCLFV